MRPIRWFSPVTPMSFIRSGSRTLDTLERRFGGLALPGLLRWVGGFQFLVFILMRAVPEYALWLDFHPDKIFSGEVWRLVSFVFFPRSNSVLFILIALMFLWFISDSLENAWGVFRVNLYVLATVLLLSVASLNPLLADYSPVALPNGDVVNIWNYSGVLNIVLYSAVFLAFAAEYPEQIIRLFLIIPIKVKWLGLANGAILVLSMIGNLSFCVVLPGMLPFLIIYTPRFLAEMRQRGDAAARRARFQAAARQGTEEAFHTCERCGKTDVSDPEAEFRVSATGDEYCADCLAESAPGKPAQG